MLLPNQRKAIQDTVNRGEMLSADMGSALLAAFQEAELAQINVSQQLDVTNHEKSRLEWSRDETIRLKQQLEREIDQRVMDRTIEIRSELRLAKEHQERAESSATFYEKQYREGQAEQSKMNAAICKLKGLVEQQLPESFLTRLWWRRSARRVLKEVERLD